jgi:hypothetical protein
LVNPLSDEHSLAYRMGMRSYEVVEVRTDLYRELVKLGHGRRASIDVARELRYACSRTLDTSGIPEAEVVLLERLYPQLCMQHYRMLEESDKTKFARPSGIVAGSLNSMARLFCLLAFSVCMTVTYLYRLASFSTTCSVRSTLSRAGRSTQGFLTSKYTAEGLFNLSGVIILAAVITSGPSWQSIVSLVILCLLQSFEFSTIRLGLLGIISVSVVWRSILDFAVICGWFVVIYVPTHLASIGLTLMSASLLRFILRRLYASERWQKSKPPVACPV